MVITGGLAGVVGASTVLVLGEYIFLVIQLLLLLKGKRQGVVTDHQMMRYDGDGYEKGIGRGYG